MKRIFPILLLVVFTSVSAGCGAWWQQLRNDPIAALTEGAGYLMNAASLAELAFNVYAEGNPGVDAHTRAEFSSILGSVRNGVATAQAGLRVASTLHQDHLDSGQLLHDAQDSMAALATFLRNLPIPPGSAASPLMASAILRCDEAARRP